MRLITPEQMRQTDKEAITQLGIPGIVLMENAALHVAQKAQSMLEKSSAGSVVIIAGTGNNGGDAHAVARLLYVRGYKVKVFSLAPVEDLKGDALINGMILENLGIKSVVLDGEEAFFLLKEACLQAGLVIDGLFGTGLNRNVEGLGEKVIHTINRCAHSVLSIDIPSGIDGLTGAVLNTCVHAQATVTFFLPKIGQVLYPGAFYTGELVVADISIPHSLFEPEFPVFLTDSEKVKSLLPKRPADGHKGTFGKVLAFSGSAGMYGAPYLCAAAAYRTGSGIVRLVLPEACLATVSALIPEAIFVPLEKTEDVSVARVGEPGDHGGDDLLKKLLEDSEAVLVGPGLSCDHRAQALMKRLTRLCEKPSVFDGDALNLMAADKSLLENLKCEAVITPHPTEMARLTGLSTAEVQADRLGVARRFAEEYGLTVVLKGASSVIATNDGRAAINPTGNSGMATGGSGDVLAGILASLLGQGLEPFDAAVAAVYLHGLAGDLEEEEKGEHGLIASDILKSIPKAILKVTAL